MNEVFEFAIEGTFIVIGLVEWLKKLNIKNFSKWTPYISLLLSIVLGCIAAYSNYENVTIWNIVSCSGIVLAMVQLGYQAIVQGIITAVESFVSTKKKQTQNIENKGE